MNIVIINDYASVQGGAAWVAISSAVGLADLGHSVTYIYGTGGSESCLSHRNIKLVFLDQKDLISCSKSIFSAAEGIWNFSVERKIFEVLNTLDRANTVIHVHSWVKSLSVSVFYPIYKLKFPLVLTLHDYFSICPNGGFYNYVTQRPCDCVPMSAKCFFSNCDARCYLHKIWRIFRQLVYKRIEFPKRTLNFITVSEFSENILKQHLSFDAVFWRIANPVTSDQKSPALPHMSEKLTFIGRLSPEKGLALLTKLIRFSKKSFRFVGSGDLEPLLRQALPNAEFLGWCNKSEIETVLADTRVLLFTSQLYETQGLVVAEAAARGVPAIVSDISAAKDFVEHGKNGLLFKSGSVESLERQIELVCADDLLVKKMGLEAYSRYWDSPLSLSVHVQNLLNCYESIMQNE